MFSDSGEVVLAGKPHESPVVFIHPQKKCSSETTIVLLYFCWFFFFFLFSLFRCLKDSDSVPHVSVTDVRSRVRTWIYRWFELVSFHPLLQVSAHRPPQGLVSRVLLRVAVIIYNLYSRHFTEPSHLYMYIYMYVLVCDAYLAWTLKTGVTVPRRIREMDTLNPGWAVLSEEPVILCFLTRKMCRLFKYHCLRWLST